MEKKRCSLGGSANVDNELERDHLEDMRIYDDDVDDFYPCS